MNNNIIQPAEIDAKSAIDKKAFPKIKPIWCDACMEDSAEFVRDVGRFEVYQCPKCGLQRDVAVR